MGFQPALLDRRIRRQSSGTKRLAMKRRLSMRRSFALSALVADPLIGAEQPLYGCDLIHQLLHFVVVDRDQAVSSLLNDSYCGPDDL